MQQDIDNCLVTALYEQAVYGGDWQPALTRFRTLLDSAEAALTVGEAAIASWRTESNGYILSAEVRTQYFRHYGHFDPKLTVLAQHGPGFLFNDASLFSDDFIRKDPFYQEYSLPIGGGHTLHTVLRRNSEEIVYLATMRAFRRDPYDAEAERQFRNVSDHFLRAVKLKQKIDASEMLASSARSALDRLRLGVVVLDTNEWVIVANLAAERACLPGEPFQLHRGYLSARQTQTAAKLKALIGQALQPHGVPGTLRAGRQDGSLWSVWIAPLPAQTALSPHHGPGALVLIGRAGIPATLHKEELISIYALTQAEAGLALALARGDSLAEAAAMRGVKLSTARSQLLSILQKTGARRQSDLIRLLSNLPGAALRGNA